MKLKPEKVPGTFSPSIDGIRSLLALLGEGDVGLFVSTGGFTRDAEEEVRRQENRRIMLVERKELRVESWTM